MSGKKMDGGSSDSLCFKALAKNRWLVGGVVMILVVIFSVAMFRPRGRGLNEAGRMRGLQDNFNQPPLNMASPGMSPRTGRAFAQAQQAAIPNMLGCPFCGFKSTNPNIGPGGAARCPNCFRNIGLNNAQTGGGFTNAAFPCVGGGGGFTRVAMPAGCATCPNVAQCFPNAQPVALTQNLGTAPPIFRDAIMLHEYRGVCSNCHIINPDIPIQASSQMPHEYRGVCSNCHTILATQAGVR